MKVWITKYALTSGIIEINAEITDNGSAYDMGTSFPTYYHEEGKEWHRTKESAIAKAEEMRKKKISSLQKQIKKLENINFEQGFDVGNDCLGNHQKIRGRSI